MSRFYPFKQKNRVGKERIYEKISLSYNTALQNRVNFKLTDFDKEDFSFIDQLNNGMQHTFSIGLPTFSLFKYLNFTPGVSYGMNWFFRSSEAFYNEETGRVETKMGKQFGDFGATHNYSGSLGMSTRLYGMYNFGKFRRIQAIRHVVSPTVSFSYSPDKATSFNGWRTLTYTDKSGVEHEYDYNIYAGCVDLHNVNTRGQSRLYGRCSSKSCMVGDLKHLPSERRQTDASYHCHHVRPTDVRALDDGYLSAYVARPTSPAVAHLCSNGTLCSNIGHQYHHTQRDL